MESGLMNKIVLVQFFQTKIIKQFGVLRGMYWRKKAKMENRKMENRQVGFLSPVFFFGILESHSCCGIA